MTTSRTTLPAFMAAEGLSLVADSAFLVVLPWLVLTVTNEPATASLVLAAAMVPAVVAGIVGGYVIDRFGRRRSSVVASVGSAFAVTALALSAAADGLTVTALVVFGLLANVFGTPALTARDALMADVARAGDVPIERVAGLRQTVFAVAFLGGPAAAGLLVAVVPAPATLLVLVACWSAAALITAVMPLAPASEHDLPAVAAPPLGSLWLRVARHPVLLVSIVVGVGSGLITAPLTSVVLPAHFRDLGQPALFGVAVALAGAGSLVGSIVYAALAARAPGPAYAAMVALTTTGFALMATWPGFALVLTAQFAIGLGAGILGPFVMVAITRNTAEAERGRVLGMFNALGLGASPAGLAMFAPLVAVAGIRGGAVAILAGWVLLALVLIVRARSLLGDPHRAQRRDLAHHR